MCEHCIDYAVEYGERMALNTEPTTSLCGGHIEIVLINDYSIGGIDTFVLNSLLSMPIFPSILRMEGCSATSWHVTTYSQ